MDIKIIATDVDGTLVKDDHISIPPINKESLCFAKENNIKIAISTGRPYSLTDREGEYLGCIDYFILSNGATIIDGQSMEVIYSCYLTKETMKRLMDIFNKYPLVYELYADGAGYISKYTYDHYFETRGLPEVFLEDYRERMIVVDNLDDIAVNKSVEKVNINHIPDECFEDLKEELNHISGLVYTAGFVGNMEITSTGADKGKALRWLAHELGSASDNVMTFGDSGNDVTMLEYAKHSYAMLNGNEKAKKAAKYITKLDNNEGGVGDTIKEYLTNNKK